MADVAQFSLTDAAYAAGLFDGEGCVQLYLRFSGKQRKHNCMRAALSVSGVDLRPLYWLQERFGGAIRIYDEPRENRRPLGNWVATSYGADRFARAILPYSTVKKEQLELWLEARANLMGPRGYQWKNPMTQERLDARQAMVDRIKELKRVG